MKTIYIDIYFLINFTVDILAMFISLKMIHYKISIRRLILGGILGASLAVLKLFASYKLFDIALAVIFILITVCICCNKASVSRKIKFALALYISSFIIGGAVDFLYNLIDKYMGSFSEQLTESTNRRAILFSLIILLIIGAIRLFIMIYSEAVDKKTVRLIITLGDKRLEVDALLDTGNLVKDPMNMNPVIFIKKNIAERLLPKSVIELSGLDELNNDFRKRIRLIPITNGGGTHVITGVRVDKVIVHDDKSDKEIDATVAIDKEDGTFGGFYALAPYVAFCYD